MNNKVMFSVNGMTISSINVPANKQVMLHDKDGSLLSSAPLETELGNYNGIDLMIMELGRLSRKSNKLVVTKNDKTVECKLHYSRPYNEYRITYSIPNSKYKSCTNYDWSEASLLNTLAAIITNTTSLNINISKQVVNSLGLNIVVASDTQENDW